MIGWRKTFLALFLVLSLGACKEVGNGMTGGGDRSGGPAGGGGNDQGNGTNTNLDALLKQDIPFEFDPKVAGSQFQLVEGPDWLAVNAATGVLTGTPTAMGNFTAKLQADGKAYSVSLGVDGDPLAKYQWHHENTGQKNFADTAGTPGEDMRVKEAHKLGAFGSGVRVMVSDDGLQIAHPDLKNNHREGKSKNYALSFPFLGDPTTNGQFHGTSVSGIIAAEGWNNLGVRGVAPLARINGANYIPYQTVPGALIDQAANNAKYDAEYDVFNQSWGSPYGYFGDISNAYLNQFIYGATVHRGGKGSVYVRSAGNQGERGFVLGKSGTTYSFGRTLPSGVDEQNAHPFAIVVGATNASGKHSSYSSRGANLWVSAPGGEYGSDLPNGTDPKFGMPAIMTTDFTGCNQGYAKTNSGLNPFDDCGAENKNGDYTSGFNGTSSAAPNTSGVVALLLGTNSNLTFRDVKHILAKTADKIDPGLEPVDRDVGGTNVTLQDGWVTNAAGYPFSAPYGFGRVNAKAAVEMAKNFTSLPPLKATTTKGSCTMDFCANDTWRFTSDAANNNKTVTNNMAAGVTSEISVTDNLVIEAVQIRLNIDTALAGDLQVELTSPSGTKSIVLQGFTSLVDDDFVNQVLLTNAFYGETSAGTWTLRVRDVASTNVSCPNSDCSFVGTTNSTLQNWAINVWGHDP